MEGFPGLEQINAILQNSDSLTNSATQEKEEQRNFQVVNQKAAGGEDFGFQSPINQVQPSQVKQMQGNINTFNPAVDLATDQMGRMQV